MLADPSSVASSVFAGRDRRSRSHEIRESTRDRSRSRSSQSSPSRGRDSHEGRRCARSWSGGRVTGLVSRSHVPQTVRGVMDEGALAVTRHAPLLPVFGLGGPGRGLWTATGPFGFGVRLRSQTDRSQSRQLQHLPTTVVWNSPMRELIGSVMVSSPLLLAFGTLSLLLYFRLPSTFLPSKGRSITTLGTRWHDFFFLLLPFLDIL